MTKSRWVMTCTTVMMALAVSAAIAGQPAEGLAGQGRGPAQAQVHRFNDNDRLVTRTWYAQQNQRSLPVGFRVTDRFAPSVELQFQEGFVIDRTLRVQVHSVPSALLRLLAPAPRTYRYVVIGDHIVLIDSNYRVYDVIHVGHDR